MVGLPGSGKTTFAEQLVARGTACGQRWIRVSQDLLKKRDACLRLAASSLQDGINVVIDRTNQTAEQVRGGGWGAWLQMTSQRRSISGNYDFSGCINL